MTQTRTAVALLAEGVDRNFSPAPIRYWFALVALLAEGVDRNMSYNPPAAARNWVALLAEGVDRNWMKHVCRDENGKSPSSRRAWIEIIIPSKPSVSQPVALLAEGVDRNFPVAGQSVCGQVALLAEGVDRNTEYEYDADKNGGRPPRGGRG